MHKKIKIILGLILFSLFIAVAAKFLIKKSNEYSPLFYVLYAKTEIKKGDVITESMVQPVLVTASAVKRQAFFWSVDGLSESQKTEMNAAQIKKVVGRTATKPFNPGDQITVLEIN